MAKPTDRQTSPQILGNWDFISVDRTTIIMVSPPSSTEPLTPVDDEDSTPEVVTRVRGNDPDSADFSGISLPERATTPKSPSSTVGNARVLGKERAGQNACVQKRQASAGNVRLSSGKQLAVSDSPSTSMRGESKVSGNRIVSAGNAGLSTEKEPNAAAAKESRRELPPTLAAPEQWGSGKWKEDWRTKRKKVDEKTDTMFLKEVIEAIVRNSEEVKKEDVEEFSFVEILKSMGIKFPD